MSEIEGLLDLIHGEVLRVLHRVSRRTPVKVDSYDKQTHSVKLKLMPDSDQGGDGDVITGWIPLHPQQTGNGAGFHIPPNTGDHGWLEFHEDDREGGTFQQATFNDKFPPDKTVDAGEFKYIHPKTQSQFYFKNDGSVTIRGMNTSNSNGGNNQNQNAPAGNGTSGGSSTSQDNSKQTVILAADGSVTVQDGKQNKIVWNGTDTITATDAAGDTIVMKGGEIKLTNQNGSYVDVNGNDVTVHSPGGQIVLDNPNGKILIGSPSASIPVMLLTGPSVHIFGDK